MNDPIIVATSITKALPDACDCSHMKGKSLESLFTSSLGRVSQPQADIGGIVQALKPKHNLSTGFFRGLRWRKQLLSTGFLIFPACLVGSLESHAQTNLKRAVDAVKKFDIAALPLVEQIHQQRGVGAQL